MPITNISAEELQKMLKKNPDLQVVDVRTEQEYVMLGHIPQAQLIPIYELPYAFRVLNRNEDVVVLCQHGIRSIDACYFLEAQGFDRIYNLIEGMSAWTGEVELDTQSTNS